MGEIYTFGELIKQQLTISKDEEQLNGFIYTKLYLNGWEKISSVLPGRGTRKKKKVLSSLETLSNSFRYFLD